ncbi:hypothetical protein BT96DRAFT_912758 [Gymnopus androsaceus JB14]|uniref:Uncharacterized protein n=1 Tax=Gymnopus androsaceus JB14 TaxID=1447944 RepID=A0A6A4IRM4_9AGAR|nr:hypothetical protein BT96DRAFT_912758 [Gymnopus androsaceus JB14]
MSCHSLATSSDSSSRSMHPNTTNSTYRMRALSTSTSTTPEPPLRRDTPPRIDLVTVSAQYKPTHKSSSGHVLIRARNANVPILLRHHQKKTSRSSTSRLRQTLDDSDYEEPQPHLQRVKKQKTKSSEQLQAEERRMLDRKAELEEDPLLDASRMCPDRVWCIPCNKYIQIDSRRQFYATLWYKHRGKRHGDVPLKRSELSNLDTQDMDVDMDEEECVGATKRMEKIAIESPVALAVPLIDDAFASSILADMYSKAQGLRLLSLAAAALG